MAMVCGDIDIIPVLPANRNSEIRLLAVLRACCDPSSFRYTYVIYAICINSRLVVTRMRIDYRSIEHGDYRNRAAKQAGLDEQYESNENKGLEDKQIEALSTEVAVENQANLITAQKIQRRRSKAK